MTERALYQGYPGPAKEIRATLALHRQGFDVSRVQLAAIVLARYQNIHTGICVGAYPRRINEQRLIRSLTQNQARLSAKWRPVWERDGYYDE